MQKRFLYRISDKHCSGLGLVNNGNYFGDLGLATGRLVGSDEKDEGLFTPSHDPVSDQTEDEGEEQEHDP